MEAKARRWLAILPPLTWLPRYQAHWLRADAVAGVTLAAYALPVSMAYSALAGLPPQAGIYGYLIGCLLYAVFGSSRQLALGPTSAISLLVGTTIATMASGDAARWAAIASLVALIVGAISVLAWLLRLSSLVNFVSETILVGFKAGAALTIAMSQLPKLFGVKGGGESFFERAHLLWGQLGDTNLTVLCFGLVAIALLVAGEKWLPGRPVALGVVVLAIVVMSTTSLVEHGVAIVGELPRGFPELRPPSVRLRDVDGVIPLAFAVFLLAYIEGVAAARAIADKNGTKIDARQELLALGAANLAVGFTQGFPVAGGLSQSAVNDKAGAKSPLALVFASLMLSVCLLFLTGLLSNFPKVLLGSIVLVAVKGLIDVPQIRALWRVSRAEFFIAIVALVGVLLLGILDGVLVAAIISVVLLLARTSRPYVAFLGRIPATRRFSDLALHPENEQVPDAIIFRVEASLLYFNAEHVKETVMDRVILTRPRLVIADLSNTPMVDLAGARMLAAMHAELAAQGIALRLAEAHAHVRELLLAAELDHLFGSVKYQTTVDEMLQDAAATT